MLSCQRARFNFFVLNSPNCLSGRLPDSANHKKRPFIPPSCSKPPARLPLFMRRSKTSYLIELLIHAIFWLAVYYALKALTANAFQLLSRDQDNVVSQDGRMPFPYAWIVLLFLMLLFYSSGFWLLKKTRRIIWLASWLIIVYALDYVVIWALAAPAGAVMPGPPGPPGQLPGLPPLPAFTTGNWQNLQPVLALIFLLVMGLSAAYCYISESISRELLRSQTELQFLRSQVNPHFLFNTLNNLFSMAQKDGNDRLADKIAQLSGMMRYMLYDSNTERVPLAQEIHYLQDCIALYQLRFMSESVAVNFYHPEPVPNVELAPMLFIPFLENAFKHGVAPGQPLRIALSIETDKNKLSFSCENTDHSAIEKPAAEKGGIGLENIKRRLELLYPGKHHLSAGPANGNYYVTLQLYLS
jgi:two-component system LytT family sensor kinase